MTEQFSQILPQMIVTFLYALATVSTGFAALTALVCLLCLGCQCRSEARSTKPNDFGLIGK
jgi:hypothetical protein